MHLNDIGAIFFLLDCPPLLNMLTINAFVAAYFVIIQIQYVKHAIKIWNEIIKTIYDRRNRLAIYVSKQLQMYFKNEIYKTFVLKNVRLV